MPETEICYYQEKDGVVPVYEWLETLRRQYPKALAKCLDAIHLLENYGYELRRPHADYLDNGIYELRIRYKNSQFRILYFFFGKNVVILSNGLMKEKSVPSIEIELANERRKAVELDPGAHIKREDIFYEPD